jgi:peptidyl-prolyl cis-trans isomerase D
MLDALRKSVGSWVAKIFIGLLMLSFAVWGVSDVFRGYRGAEIARVGETEIPAEVFRNALQREIQMLSQRIGTYLTMDQARSVGIDRQVLGRLIAEAALNEEARRRGLNMSDSAVAASIRADATFQAPGGQFDRTYFNQYLAATGYSEGMYVAEQRQRLLRHAIGEAIGGRPEAPEVLAAAIDRYRNEERHAEYLLVTAEALEDVPEPDEDELVAYFEDNRSDFRAPEYRRLALISLQAEDIVDMIEVSEEDARASYEARAGQFSRAERRTIEQIAFDSMDDAAAARAEIDEGRSFEEIAEERGLAGGDHILGTLTQDEIVDRAIAEAAFRLEEGAVSDPVDGMFAPALIRVTDIESGTEQRFEDAADQVRRDLAMDRAQGEILDLYDMIEDGRAAGMTFAEIAERYNLPHMVVEMVDRQGRDESGEPIASLPRADRLLDEAFQTDIGVEADPVQYGTDGYVWFDVLDTIPGRNREFEEAREDVVEAWRASMIRDRINARAEEIADELRAGAQLTDLAGESPGIRMGTSGPLRRNTTSGVFGEAAVGRIFTTPRGEIAVAEASDPQDRIVFRVSRVSVPDYTPGEDDAYRREIVTGIADDLVGQYLVQLQDRLGVSVNQQALRRVFGETDEF